VAWPKEWEIPVQDPVEPDQAPGSSPPPGPPVAPAPEPDLVPGNAPQAEGGDPGTPAPITPPPQSEVPVELGKQARNRRPPGYLADYPVGPVNLLPLEHNPRGTGRNSHSRKYEYLDDDNTIEFTYRRSADTEPVELPN